MDGVRNKHSQYKYLKGIMPSNVFLHKHKVKCLRNSDTRNRQQRTTTKVPSWNGKRLSNENRIDKKQSLEFKSNKQTTVNKKTVMNLLGKYFF